ncbi:MAG TPA: hypothetical protein VFK89_06440, partial [Actinomycetota bacterium]|nr:hypothetical protein [Actinomycetota bacterium]
IRKRGMTHVVTWRANVTDAGTYQEERPCRYAGHALGAGFSRDARARGRIFRRSLAPTHDAILEVGAMASQCLSPHLHFDDAGRLERIEIAAGWR